MFYKFRNNNLVYNLNVMLYEYTRGQILWGDRNNHKDAIHPIVYLIPSTKSPDHFVGLMLTSTNNFPDRNLIMEVGHFENGFVYCNTHVVRALLMKPAEWGPFTEDGNLSASGLLFIENNIPLDEEILWKEYLTYQK
jgi:hypothetical protein